MKLKNKSGFTLIEMMAVLAIVGGITMINAKSQSHQAEQLQAKAFGSEIHQYNLGVSKYLAFANDALSNEEKEAYAGQSRQGSSWLKNGEFCDSGSGDLSFVDCAVLPGGGNHPEGSSIYGDSAPTTTFYLDGDAIKATTIWSPATHGGRISESFMGLASLVAMGSYIHSEDTMMPGGSTMFCPDIDYHDSKIQSFCGSNKGLIVSKNSPLASASAGAVGEFNEDDLLDQYLSTQGLNTMRGYLEFKDDGEPSSQSALDSVDSTTWRQIVNVARIYNRGESGSDSIILGSRRGEAIYSNSFILDNNLLNNSVIIDGNLGVVGSVLVSGDIYANIMSAVDMYAYNLSVTGDMSVGGSLKADRADIGEINTFGDITIRHGDLHVKSMLVDEEVVTDRLVARGIIEANKIETPGLINARELIMTYDANAGDACEFIGSINFNNSYGKVLVCLDNKWVETRYVQTGGLLVPRKIDNHDELLQNYVYNAPGGLHDNSMNGYYEVSQEVYNNARSGLGSFRGKSCDGNLFTGFMRYKGNGVFQCISS